MIVHGDCKAEKKSGVTIIINVLNITLPSKRKNVSTGANKMNQMKLEWNVKQNAGKVMIITFKMKTVRRRFDSRTELMVNINQAGLCTDHIL